MGATAACTAPMVINNVCIGAAVGELTEVQEAFAAGGGAAAAAKFFPPLFGVLALSLCVLAWPLWLGQGPDGPARKSILGFGRGEAVAATGMAAGRGWPAVWGAFVNKTVSFVAGGGGRVGAGPSQARKLGGRRTRDMNVAELREALLEETGTAAAGGSTREQLLVALHAARDPRRKSQKRPASGKNAQGSREEGLPEGQRGEHAAPPEKRAGKKNKSKSKPGRKKGWDQFVAYYTMQLGLPAPEMAQV